MNISIYLGALLVIENPTSVVDFLLTCKPHIGNSGYDFLKYIVYKYCCYQKFIGIVDDINISVLF